MPKSRFPGLDFVVVLSNVFFRDQIHLVNDCKIEETARRFSKIIQFESLIFQHSAIWKADLFFNRPIYYMLLPNREIAQFAEWAEKLLIS